MNNIFILLSLLMLTIFANAQSERILLDSGIKRLSVFIGTWKSKNSPKFNDGSTAIYNCQWSASRNYLICDQMVKSRNGKSNNLAIYSFDSLNNYKLTLIGVSDNRPFSIPVTSRGDTLIYSGSYMLDSTIIYTRTLNIFKNRNKYYYVSQSSLDRKTWKIILDGTASKIVR